MKAEPLTDEFCLALDNKEVAIKGDQKDLCRELIDKYGWDSTDTKKIWCFGPDDSGPNVMVD